MGFVFKGLYSDVSGAIVEVGILGQNIFKKRLTIRRGFDIGDNRDRMESVKG